MLRPYREVLNISLTKPLIATSASLAVVTEPFESTLFVGFISRKSLQDVNANKLNTTNIIVYNFFIFLQFYQLKTKFQSKGNNLAERCFPTSCAVLVSLRVNLFISCPCKYVGAAAIYSCILQSNFRNQCLWKIITNGYGL